MFDFINLVFVFIAILMAQIALILLFKLILLQYRLGKKYGFDAKQYKKINFLYCDKVKSLAYVNIDFAQEVGILKKKFFNFAMKSVAMVFTVVTLRIVIMLSAGLIVMIAFVWY